MEKRVIKVGSRDSKLAVAQSGLIIKELRAAHPALTFELLTFKTTGDLILDRPLDQIGGKGLFVKELDRALLDGAIDLAVHSLKDLPMEQHPDLPLAAVSKRADPRDALILPPGGTENLLETIGTSSARRRIQLERLFPETGFAPMRGNIQTRLGKLDGGTCSALVLAAAGLIRAGLAGRISRFFTTGEIIPAAGQGILAVQCRRDFDAVLLHAVNNPISETAAAAERGFVRTLEGGCSSPTAAYAELHGNELRLTGLYAGPKSGAAVTGTIAGAAADAAGLGERLALELKGRAE